MWPEFQAGSLDEHNRSGVSKSVRVASGDAGADNGGVQRPEPSIDPGHAGVVPVQGRARPGALRGQGEEPAQPGDVVLRHRPAWSAPARWWRPPTPSSGSRSRNEVEALFLEFNLIQKHRPRFNIRYKDDKSYPYLAVTLDEEWPRAMVLRGAKRKGVRYFGPYAHAYAIRETLDLLLRTFPIRTCTKGKFDRYQRLGRPCLYAHIEKCAAPCVGCGHARGVRRPRQRAAPVPRRRHRADPRPARQADARGERRARVRARGAAARPDRVGAQGDRAPADGRREGRGLRRHRHRRRRARGVGAGVPRAQGSRRRPQGRWSSTRSRTSRRRSSSAACSNSSTAAPTPTTSRARSSSPTSPTTSPLYEEFLTAARRARVAPARAEARREARAARRRSPRTRRRRSSVTSCGAPPTTTRARARCSRCRRRSHLPEAPLAHRVLRRVEPPGHRDRGVDGGDGGRAAEALRLPAVQDPPPAGPGRLRGDGGGADPAVPPLPRRARRRRACGQALRVPAEPAARRRREGPARGRGARARGPRARGHLRRHRWRSGSRRSTSRATPSRCASRATPRRSTSCSRCATRRTASRSRTTASSATRR